MSPGRKESGQRLLGGHRKLAVGSLLSACTLGGAAAAGLTLAGSPAAMDGGHTYHSSLEAAQGRSPLATEGRLSPNGAYFEVPGTLFPYLHRSHLSSVEQRVVGAPSARAGVPESPGSGRSVSAGGRGGGATVPVPQVPQVSPNGTSGSGTSPGGIAIPRLNRVECVPLASLPLPVQLTIKLHLRIDGVKVQIRHTKSGPSVCGRLPKSLLKKKRHGLPGLPGIPDLPGLPGLPGLPDLPDLPGIPDPAGVTLPTLPSLPAASTGPTL